MPVNPVCRGTATARPGVPDHRVISVVIGTNADLIAAVSALWIVDGDVVLDPTWGQGAFWRLGSPDGLIAHDLKTDGIDFRKLPEADASVDVVVFDPPYRPSHGARQRMDSPTPTDLPSRSTPSTMCSRSMKTAYERRIAFCAQAGA